MKVQIIKKHESYFVRYRKKGFLQGWKTVGMNHNWSSRTVHDAEYTRRTKQQAEEVYNRLSSNIEIIKQN